MKGSTIVAVLCVMAVAVCAAGQTAQRSTIAGVVTDGSHAVLVGATVTLTGPGLPAGSIATITDPRGAYRFGNLLPAEYVLTIKREGFKTILRRGIALPVETTFTIDVPLELSSIAATVDVEAPTPLVDVRTAASPAMLSNAMLRNLPTSRSLVDILNLAPGIGVGIVYTEFQGSSIAYGGTQGSNGVTIDGVSIVESNQGDARVALNYDWLDHVQIVALGANAEYGGTTGAIANGVLRSGTNRFSGLGEYLWKQPSWQSDNTESLPDIWRNLRKPLPLITWNDTSAQLGGPIARDRMWFFAGLEYLHHDYPPPGLLDGTRNERRPRAVLKIDAAPSTNIRLQGFYERDTADIDGFGGYAPMATTQVATIRNHVWNARATWSPGAATMIDARVSGFRRDEDDEPRPPYTRAGPPYIGESGDGIVPSSGAANYFELHQRTLTGAASMTRHLDFSGHSHQLKAGIEFEYAPTESLQGYSGGLSYAALNGVLQTVTFWDGQHNRLTNRRTTLFMQDRWAPFGRITFELGVRLDVNRGSVPTLGDVFFSSPLAPRLGVAWDLKDDHRTVIRGHYGRYHDMLLNGLYSYKDVSALSPKSRYQIVDGTIGPLIFLETPPIDVAIPKNIRQPHVDQWTVGSERQIMRDLALELQYIRRNFGSFIGYVDPSLNLYPRVLVRDPGPDGTVGTSDDGGVFQIAQVLDFGQRIWFLTNPDNAWRHYNAIQVVARKRESHNWQMQASYTWSRSSGTVDNIDHTNLAQGTLSPLAGVGGNPNVANQGAGEPTFAFNEAKILGSWRAPRWGGFVVSGVGRWQTGVRWNRIFFSGLAGYSLINAEPLGSRIAPSIATLDLRVEKTVPVPNRGVRVGVMVDLFNALNAAAPLAMSGFSGPRFGLPNTLILPRSVRAGFRITF
ncbi:MAG: TonB-dependent receptor [Acidobacteriota bacterium]